MGSRSSSGGPQVRVSADAVAAGPWRNGGRSGWPLPEIAGLVAFGLVLALVGPTHEPWFDEAQAWLIARDADPWLIVRELGREEGTPTLWHLLLWVLQRADLPYGSFWMVSGALGTLGVGVVLFRAPFPLWARLGIAASYFAVYQSAIVARSYALDLALLPLVAALAPHRSVRPIAYGAILALLANANLFSTLIAGVLWIEFAVAESNGGRAPGRGALVGLGLAAAGGALAALQVLPRPPSALMSCCEPSFQPLRALVILSEGFGDPELLGGGAVGAVVSLVLTVAALVAFGALWRAARLGWLALALFAGQAALASLRQSHLGHSGLFFLTALFLLWRSWPAFARLPAFPRQGLLAMLAIVLAIADIDDVAACVRDAVTPYSGSRSAAPLVARLAQAYPERSLGAVGFKVFALQPYLLHNPFRQSGVPTSYFLWRRGFAAPSAAKLSGVADILERRPDAFVMSDDDAAGARHGALTVRAAVRGGYRAIAFFPGRMVWKVGTTQPDGLFVFVRQDEDWSALRTRPRPSGSRPSAS